MKTIEFENTAFYITARDGNDVLIRCNFDYTDCRDNESLDSFTLRHGGTDSTIEYLKECYRRN